MALGREGPAFVKLLGREEPAEVQSEADVVRVHLNAEIVIDFPPLMGPGRIAAILRALRL